jgi:hypothetical protein
MKAKIHSRTDTLEQILKFYTQERMSHDSVVSTAIGYGLDD